ncbi:MAG: site-specific DNA-methyltransferase [Gammaproteobacteria bacterium]
MPTIEFNGKWNIYAAHLTTPFRPLEINKKRSVAPRKNADGNLIVHGDNLHALKSLLPYYGGRVNCVYIDPPYNTGNEGWCYNDNLNAPLMKRWLRDNGEVDREDEERHDKWLCMMWPRLNLLRDLLAENGVIFVSIDDNEVHRLRMIMDEIFGADCFIASIVVKVNPGGRDYGGIALTHDYVLVYAKSDESILNPIPVENGALPYKDEIGNFALRELRNRNIKFNSQNRPNLFYAFYVNPQAKDNNGLCDVSLSPKKGWVKVTPLKSKGVQTVWRWGKEKSLSELNVNVKGKSKRDGGFQIVEKYRSETKRERSILDSTEYRNERGTLTLKAIFDGAVKFDYPKSDYLIKKLLALGTQKDSIVLDSFAGSGTTAQAVMELNKEDGGNRQFILVECEKYADTVTAERTRRVIKKLHLENEQSLVKNSFNGNFTFCTLGKEIGISIMLSRKKLPDYETVARCAALNLTGAMLDKVKRGKDWFFGETENYRLHLIYEPEASFLKSTESAFTLETAKRIGKAAAAQRKTALVFGTQQFVSQKELNRCQVIFCKLPYYVVNSFG